MVNKNKTFYKNLLYLKVLYENFKESLKADSTDLCRCASRIFRLLYLEVLAKTQKYWPFKTPPEIANVLINIITQVNFSTLAA